MRTLVKLKISQAAHAEIAAAVRKAGAAELIMRCGAVNMDGIAVVPDPEQELPPGIVLVPAESMTTAAFRELYQLDNLESDHAN